MPNEIRPCTLWGETFDAIGATVLPSGRDIGVYTKDHRVIRFEFATREALEIGYMEAITAIAEALNAPVLATDAVLAGLPDEGTVDCTWEELPKFEVQVSPNENYDEEKEVMWMKPFYAFDEYPNGTIEGWFVYAPYYTEDGDWDMALTSIKELKMRATNNETAEYLRQFTLDGVRINKEKETSHD